MMRICLLLTLLLSSSLTLLAKDIPIRACTSDGYVTTLTLTFSDQALTDKPLIETSVSRAFVETARTLSAEDVTGAAGYFEFIGRLTAEEYHAIEFNGAPVVDRRAACNPKETDHNRQ